MNDNISFPPRFKALRGLPGYFWNEDEKKLYSIKINGIMKPLTLNKPSKYAPYYEPYYRVCKNGKSMFIALSWIPNRLLDNHTIPVKI